MLLCEESRKSFYQRSSLVPKPCFKLKIPRGFTVLVFFVLDLDKPAKNAARFLAFSSRFANRRDSFISLLDHRVDHPPRFRLDPIVAGNAETVLAEKRDVRVAGFAVVVYGVDHVVSNIWKTKK